MLVLSSSVFIDMAKTIGGCSPEVAEKLVSRVLYCYPNISEDTFKKICQSVHANKRELISLLTSSKNADVQRGYFISLRD